MFLFCFFMNTDALLVNPALNSCSLAFRIYSSIWKNAPNLKWCVIQAELNPDLEFTYPDYLKLFCAHLKVLLSTFHTLLSQ